MQKSAYGLRISDWSSDVYSSDLVIGHSEPDCAQAASLSICASTKPLSDTSCATRARSEERPVGKECVSTFRSWLPPYHPKKKTFNMKVMIASIRKTSM